MVINLKLSPHGIKDAQKQIAQFKAALTTKTELLVKRLAEIGVEVARVKFESAYYDGVNDVTVSMSQDGGTATIIADGEAVAFIEFGTGVAYPEHPISPYPHGSYGRGLGKNPKGWVYQGSPGSGGQQVYSRPKKDGSPGAPRQGYYKTRGNPPAMAMWSAVEEISAKVTQVWRDTMND